MIWAFITARGLLGLRKGWWVLIAIVALAGLVLWLGARETADDKANQEIGAAVQRETNLTETIKRTEQGNAAREEIRAPGNAGDRARYDQCVRSARTPANCRRFLPEFSADHD